MYPEERRRIIISAALAAAVLALSALYLIFSGGGFASRIVLGDIVTLLLLSVFAMLSALRASLRVTLYSYTNIGLIGGILYASVLAIVFLVYLVICLNRDSLTVSEVCMTLLRFPRYFSYYAVFVISGLSILVGISNIALIRHEGFCLNNALSLLIAGFYIGGTVAVYIISDFLTLRVFIPRELGTDRLFVVFSTVIPLFLLLLLCYLECILAGTAILGWKAARRKPAYDKDYIIILGCSIDKRGGLLPLLKGRVNRAIRFAWEQEIASGKPMKYVPSGGQGPNEILSEGSAMELYLLTRGAEEYEVFPEKRSRDTWENMCFSKEIIDSLKPGAKVAFATTNYHILRSGILARKAGLNAEGIAGDTKWYFWPNGFIREFFGILALNIRAHITYAVFTALLCGVIGTILAFGGLI